MSSHMIKQEELQSPFSCIDYSFSSYEVQYVNIKSRRYLGNKTKLLQFINSIIKENVGDDYNSFCDIFAGTGVVGEYFNDENVKVISNELLKSNYISLKTFLGTKKKEVNMEKVKKLLYLFNKTEFQRENYVSRNFGGKYFSIENARKIGAVRELAENLPELNESEKNVIITSLIYAMDKVANTCGHYDAYRRNIKSNQDIKFNLPEINFENNIKNEVYNKDANELIREIEPDILYIDPPYNSRQYCDTYHVLENITEWRKPDVYGVAKKMDRSHLKSKYNYFNQAEMAFEDLIKNAKTKYILLSYNTTENKLHTRSNATLSNDHIIKVLSEKGDLKIYELDYNQFTTGKTNEINHKERIYFVRVKK